MRWPRGGGGRYMLHNSALQRRDKRTTCLYDVPLNVLCDGSAYIKTAMVPPTTPTTTPAIPSHPAFMPIPGATTLPAAPVLCAAGLLVAASLLPVRLAAASPLNSPLSFKNCGTVPTTGA